MSERVRHDRSDDLGMRLQERYVVESERARGGLRVPEVEWR